MKSSRRGSTVVYADGGYYHGLGRGGAAWVVDRTRFRATSMECPSAELAELAAVVLAVEENEGDLVVRTDCHTHARGPATELVKWLSTRKFAANPFGEDLVERLARSVSGRSVNITRGVSKGAGAEVELVCCDLLERYTRQCERLLETPQEIIPQGLHLRRMGNLKVELVHALELRPIPGSEAGDAVKALA